MAANILSQIIGSTVEFQGWGFNALTISFCVSLVLTAIAGWGLLQQNKTIWQDKTARAVSVIWLSYYCVLQLVIFVYGFVIHSAALAVNGLLALLYIPILVGLWKFKGFTNVEKFSVTAFIAALAAMVLLPYKPAFFFAFAVGGLVSAITQPIEMWRKKSAEGLDIRLIGTILLGNVVWLVYGLAVQDIVLISINLIAFFIFGTTTLLWWQYREAKPAAKLPAS